jgi:hypothetical protein
MKHQIPLPIKTPKGGCSVSLNVLQRVTGFAQERLHAPKSRLVVPLRKSERLTAMDRLRNDCRTIAILRQTTQLGCNSWIPFLQYIGQKRQFCSRERTGHETSQAIRRSTPIIRFT